MFSPRFLDIFIVVVAAGFSESEAPRRAHPVTGLDLGMLVGNCEACGVALTHLLTEEEKATRGYVLCFVPCVHVRRVGSLSYFLVHIPISTLVDWTALLMYPPVATLVYYGKTWSSTRHLKPRGIRLGTN